MTEEKRQASYSRVTKETSIQGKLFLDGTGESKIDTGIGFFDHMLTSFAKHGGFDLELTCQGDLVVDGHHTVEDVGIVLGELFAQCLIEKKGICRFGSAFVPMDESLARTVVDISNRPYLVYQVALPSERVGAFDCQLSEEFFRAFAMNAKITLHIAALYGANSHHILEAIFKSTGRALREAVAICGDQLPSTKGCL